MLTLGELVHQVIKVELQIRRRSSSRKTYSGTSGWKGKDREKEKARRCLKCLWKRNITSHCPNRRVMIVKDYREVESESSIGEVSTSSEVECLSDDSHYEGDLLMIRRCPILGNLCYDYRWGSSVNRLVKKLVLPTIVHSRSYRLQWLSERLVLKPLTPREVYEDKKKMKVKKESERKTE
ncbi:hypothetical protein CR513_00507, partial [Mucuna pruriens]